jgi:CRP-like cAMP-binding protein
MSEERRTLAGIRLLGGLSALDLSTVEARCVWRRYGAGERIFERGTEGREVFFLVEGAVDVITPTPAGADFSFARLGAGEIFGHMAAIDGLPRAASAVAAEDALLAALAVERFVELLKRHGEIAVRLLQTLSMIIRETNDRVVSATCREGMERVYGVLLDLAVPDPASPELLTIDPFPPLRDIALRAGVSRELVASALNRLYPEGIARRRGNTLHIAHADRLREAASTS